MLSDDFGYLGCLLAIVGFGTQGIFVKSPKIQAANVHPFLIIFLVSLFLALIGVIIGFVAWICTENDPFIFMGGIWAACAYAPGNILLLWTCRRIGVGVGVGVVSASTSVFSFFLGYIQNHAAGGDLFYTIPAVILMALAAVIISCTKLPVFQNMLYGHWPNEPLPLSGIPSPDPDSHLHAAEEEDLFRNMTGSLLGDASMVSSASRSLNFLPVEGLSEFENGEESLEPRSRSADYGQLKYMQQRGTIVYMTNNQIQAFLKLGINVGAPWMVRTNPTDPKSSPLAEKRDTYATVAHHGLDLFGVAVGLTAGFFLGLQGILWDASSMNIMVGLSTFMVVQLGVTVSLLSLLLFTTPLRAICQAKHLAIAVPNALAGAVMVALALVGQVVGISVLNGSIAMPLTQLNLIVAGLWGIFYYKEITSARVIATFFAACVLDILAGLLLSLGRTL